jgi:UDP-glucose 4-epimerase
MSLKILVTGGAGFIGSTTVDRLIARGDEVWIIDDLSTGRLENLNPEAEFQQLDIGEEGVMLMFAEERFDAVMHCAAQIDVRKSVDDPVFDARSNILGTLNLLEAARRSGVKRFVFSSTGGAIYGDTEQRPTPVGAPCVPISPYGIAKLSIEHYLHYYQVIHGLESFVLRYANVYGPRQNPHGEAGVVAIFAQRMLDGRELTINGDGTQTRDYVFVEDVARANELALHDTVGGGTVNIGTGIEADVNRVFQVLNEALGAGREERHGPAKPGEQRTSCLEIGATRERLGWTPQVSLEEGLGRTAEWFRQRQAAGGPERA